MSAKRPKAGQPAFDLETYRYREATYRAERAELKLQLQSELNKLELHKLTAAQARATLAAVTATQARIKQLTNQIRSARVFARQNVERAAAEGL